MTSLSSPGRTARGVEVDETWVAISGFPVRFNGRVTTLDHVSRVLLKQLSGRAVFYDLDERERPAIEWLVGEASGGDAAQKRRVVLVADPKLVELLKLAPRPLDAKSGPRYNLEELQAVFEALTNEDQRARAVAESARTELDRAVLSLTERLMAYLMLRQSFAPPAGTSEEALQQGIERLARLDSAAIPQLVPPGPDSKRWSLLARGLLESAIIEALQPKEIKPNPAVPRIAAVLSAHRDGDREKLSEAARAYAALLKASPPPAAGFDFTVPKEWQELGVPVANTSAFFDDTLAMGAIVASFRVGEGTSTAFMQAMHFAAPIAPTDRVINHWRIRSGLTPLSVEDLDEATTQLTTGKLPFIINDILYAKDLPGPRRRVMSAVLRREQDALVVSMFGSPEALDQQRENFTAFLNSVQLAPAEAAKEWFDLREGQPAPDMSKVWIVGAVLRDGERAWSLVFNGQGALTDALRQKCRDLVAAFPASKLLAAKQGEVLPNWPPSGWRTHEADGELASYSLEADGQFVFLSVNLLEGFTPASELPLVNQWRTLLQLPPAKVADLERLVTSTKINEREVRWVEVVPAAPPAKSGPVKP